MMLYGGGADVCDCVSASAERVQPENVVAEGVTSLHSLRIVKLASRGISRSAA